jgi:hypothetical protein
LISKRLWHVRDKWKRQLGLVRNRRVARHLPPTKLLGRESLKAYLERYKVVFVKPVYGSFGNNIMKVTKNNGSYMVQRERRLERVAPERVAARVFQHTGGRPFLIQKGVTLLRINGHPIDFRLLLLKPEDKWLVMGIMGKVATANRIVTNFNHGGRPIGFEQALRSAGWREENIKRTQSEMIRIGRAAAGTFSSRYKYCRRMGIDFALDTEGRIWILEVNTNPFYDLFRYHRDKSLHGRIGRYMKQIGRLQSNR